jgi:hypothetical protein
MTTEKARAILQELATLFENPERLVGGMAATFIRAGDRPIDRWSWGNRLIAWLHGTADARTFLQWKSAGRSVRKGAAAFCILAPCTNLVAEIDEGGDEVKRAKLYGFRAVPVFRMEDTDGEPLPSYQPQAPPPLNDLPAKWGITVEYQPIPGQSFGIMGSFSPTRKRITLFTENEATFFHELLHAADDRLSPLHGGQDADQEAVAELGAAVLARLYGGRIDRDAWEYIRIYHEKPAQAIRRLLPRVEACLGLILAEAGGAAN